MPVIKVFRKKSWTTRYKVVELYLDGQRIGYVSNGEAREFDVAAGQHTLKAKMGWYGSRKFDFTIYNKEAKAITVSPNIVFVAFIPLFVIGFVLLKVYLKEKLMIRYGKYDIIPGILIMIALVFSIFGRSSYLILKEEA